MIKSALPLAFIGAIAASAPAFAQTQPSTATTTTTTATATQNQQQSGAPETELLGAQTELQNISNQMLNADDQAMNTLKPQAQQAIDRFRQAIQKMGQSDAGKKASDQIHNLDQQADAARQQLDRDPHAAAGTMQQLASAVGQLTTAAIPADTHLIIGKPLMSANGKKAGEVKDVLVGPDGKIAALVIDRGGALGLGGKNVALGWDAINIAGDQITAKMTDDQLKALPVYQTQ